MTAKREELQGEQDTVGQFLADAMEAAGAVPDEWEPLLTAVPAEYSATIRFTRVYQHYKAWAKDKCNPVSLKPFRASLKNHGYTITKNGNIETAHGFGHQKSEAARCSVCKEKLGS